LGAILEEKNIDIRTIEQYKQLEEKLERSDLQGITTKNGFSPTKVQRNGI
jgi:hypothetical protein